MSRAVDGIETAVEAIRDRVVDDVSLLGMEILRGIDALAAEIAERGIAETKTERAQVSALGTEFATRISEKVDSFTKKTLEATRDLWTGEASTWRELRLDYATRLGMVDSYFQGFVAGGGVMWSLVQDLDDGPWDRASVTRAMRRRLLFVHERLEQAAIAWSDVAEARLRGDSFEAGPDPLHATLEPVEPVDDGFPDVPIESDYTFSDDNNDAEVVLPPMHAPADPVQHLDDPIADLGDLDDLPPLVAMGSQSETDPEPTFDEELLQALPDELYDAVPDEPAPLGEPVDDIPLEALPDEDYLHGLPPDDPLFDIPPDVPPREFEPPEPSLAPPPPEPLEVIEALPELPVDALEVIEALDDSLIDAPTVLNEPEDDEDVDDPLTERATPWPNHPFVRHEDPLDILPAESPLEVLPDDAISEEEPIELDADAIEALPDEPEPDGPHALDALPSLTDALSPGDADLDAAARAILEAPTFTDFAPDESKTLSDPMDAPDVGVLVAEPVDAPAVERFDAPVAEHEEAPPIPEGPSLQERFDAVLTLAAQWDIAVNNLPSELEEEWVGVLEAHVAMLVEKRKDKEAVLRERKARLDSLMALAEELKIRVRTVPERPSAKWLDRMAAKLREVQERRGIPPRFADAADLQTEERATPRTPGPADTEPSNDTLAAPTLLGELPGPEEPSELERDPVGLDREVRVAAIVEKAERVGVPLGRVPDIPSEAWIARTEAKLEEFLARRRAQRKEERERKKRQRQERVQRIQREAQELGVDVGRVPPFPTDDWLDRADMRIASTMLKRGEQRPEPPAPEPEPEPDLIHQVVYEAGTLQEQRWIVDRDMVIGRAPSSDIQLIFDGGVSRRHCRIRRVGDAAFQLEDAGSTKGTLLDGEKIGDPKALVPGSVIQVGDTQLHFGLLPVPE